MPKGRLHYVDQIIHGCRSWKLFAHNSSRAVDFDQRLAGESCRRNRRSGRPAMGKISFEDFVHGVVVFNLRQENRELQDAVHGSATGFD